MLSEYSLTSSSNLQNYKSLYIANWKISVKDTMTYNLVRLEKGMFVEYSTMGEHPLFKTSHHEPINQLFIKKYGVDLKKIGFINESRLHVEKV